MGNGDERWITARDAVALITPYFPQDRPMEQRLIEWAKDDMVGSRCARRAEETEGLGKVYYDDESIPSEFWSDIDRADRRETADWATGTFSITIYDPYGSKSVRVHGVEFNEDDIRLRMKTLLNLDIESVPSRADQLFRAQAEAEALQAKMAALPLTSLTSKAELIGRISRAPPPITPLQSYVSVPSPRNPPRISPSASDLLPTAPALKAKKLPTASGAEVDAWFRGLPAGDQARGIRWLWQNAKACFEGSGRDVKRKQVEKFVEGRTRGRPRTK